MYVHKGSIWSTLDSNLYACKKNKKTCKKILVGELYLK